MLVAVGVGLMFSVSACESATGDSSVPGAEGQGQLQRIDALEYDRAVERTLGVKLTNDDRLALIGHDRDITPADYQDHFTRIDRVLDRVFTDASLRSRILTCTPTFASDAGCTRMIVRDVGARAWQRALTDTEVSDLTQLATSATALGVDFSESIQHVVKTMMISAPFLYRVQGV